LRELLWQEHDFNYEHLYVFFDYKTSYGFEIACNLLRDDGSEEKEQRRVLISPKLHSFVAFHEVHVTGEMITYIVVTSKEITKEEYYKLLQRKAEKKMKANELVPPLPAVLENGPPEEVLDSV
jgi:hypothetical protein